MDTREFPVEAESLEESPEEPVSEPPAQTGSTEKEQVGPQEDAQQGMDGSVAPLASGQIVEGLIVHMDDDGALVDVGTKSEGHIPASELSNGTTTDDGKVLEAGDRISVYVVRPEDDEGHPVLSKKRADYERVWRRVIDAHEKGEVLSAMVTDRVKGGLVVDLGLRGFLPASHVRTRNVHALDRFIGQSLKVKIIEVDRGRKRVVVSHKNAIEEERQRRREKTLASLEESKVYRGIVRRITDYGAFVDLGGLDGLLHITEMSWTRIKHPSEAVKVGEKIDVMVLRFDREQNRISLGLKQILPDPWEEVPKHYKVGQIVHGTITRVVPFGAFVRLDSGIEGIIPNAELPGERGKRAQDLLSAEQEVDVKIVSIRANERRMSLSLRQFEQAKERQQIKEYMQRQEDETRVTIGDLFGNVLAESQAARRQSEEALAAPEKDEAEEPAGEPEAPARESVGTEGEEKGTVGPADAGRDAEGEESSAPVYEQIQSQAEDTSTAEEIEPAPALEGEGEETLEIAGEEAKESPENADEASSSSESPAESEAEKD
ncbi:MAG: 30S ribosomal protein S1 [Armatimonadota bacterium]|nr:30S ribosomal protein S1 [Armatimonadota bacterium]